MKVPFYLHNLNEQDIFNASQVMRTPFLTTGEVVKTFEKDLAAYLSIKHVVGLTSCTMALFLVLKSLNIGNGDEVVTTPMSFVATANAILHTGATPVFADVDPATGNLDIDKVIKAITPKTKAILPVHLYGQMVQLEDFEHIAFGRNVHLIEDAAHAVESEFHGFLPGQLSKAACFSFYTTKNLTCGEGGAIATNDTRLAEKLYQMRSHGMTKNASDRYTSNKYEHYDVDLLGYKCNMDNIHAALLIDQLKRLDNQWTRKNDIYRSYREAFSTSENIGMPKHDYTSKHGLHLFTIWVDPNRRDEIMWKLQQKDIGVAVNYRPIHLMNYYREMGYREGDFPEAEKIGASTISLPFYAKMTDEQVRYVINTVLKIVDGGLDEDNLYGE